MRVLYGIQGTGNGHLTRARCLVPALRAEGIEVDCLFSGREKNDFFDMEEFGDYRCLRGFTLVVEHGELQLLPTLRKNNLFAFIWEVQSLQLDNYDLVISDFEPVTAWAATLKGLPSVGVSHQNAFHYAVPKVSGYLASRLLMRCFAPVATKLGLHWHHFKQPVLPPLIEAHAAKPPIPDKILVYMGFEKLDDIINFLQPFPHVQFFVFAKTTSRQDLGHIQINPVSHDEFHAHLEDCGGVISNAGFELASECIALGKKLLVRPLSGQYEQLSNALALQSLGRGTVIEHLDQHALEQWLRLPAHTPIQYPNVSKALAHWVKQECRQPVAALAEALWNDCHLAYNFDAEFGNHIVPNLVL